MAESALDFGDKVRFEAGDTIYEQDSESTGVYLILDGKVDIWHYEGDDASRIATIGGGELLGEVSVIEGRPHSVTAKASATTNALFINSKAFQRSFSDPLVRHVVHTLAARLRSSYGANKAQSIKDTANAPLKSSKPTLEGGSRLVANRLLTFVEMKEFPFAVGNLASNAKHSLVNPGGVRIPLQNTPELADNHFEVIRRDGHLYVRDLGSPHGTTVNAEALSKYTMTAIARLRDGKNEVIAGKPDSPVRFIITVPPTFEA